MSESPLVDEAVAGHIEHCLWQAIRFAYQLEHGWLEGPKLTLRLVQLGFNLGRFDELTGEHTGQTWRKFDPLITAEDWPGLQRLAAEYLREYGLEEPPVSHLRRL